MNAAGNEGARRESDGQGTRLAFSRSYAELVSGKSAEQHRRTPYIAPLRRGVGTLAWDSPVLPYAPKFLELRHSEVHMAPSARSGGAYNVLWMFSVSYVRQLPCVCILNLRNAQSQVISPTHIWATARYKQATARGLISPLRKASAVAIGALSGANARVGGHTQDFFSLIGGHVGQGPPQYSLRFPETLLSLPATLLSPFLSLIPTLLTLAQPEK